MKPLLLGELLLARGLVSQDELDHALDLQRKRGGRLGDILIASGVVSYRALYRAIACHYALPFVDLLQRPPDPALLLSNPQTYLHLRVLPWRKTGGRMQIAVTELSDETIDWIRENYGNQAELVVTSPFDIRRVIEQHFGSVLEARSRLSLWHRDPHASARVTMPPTQQRILIALIMAMAASAIWMPLDAALWTIAFCQAIYCATLVFKTLVFSVGSMARPSRISAESLHKLDEHQLPVYTVIIPMYKEAASLPGLLSSMQRLDYPAAKLDIKLVLEADDLETLETAYALKPRYHFDIIRVPPGTPRTKPRACNYALRFARGAYVTIFDADDRPDRLQLKKAVLAFRSLPPDVVCLQARLNYYNVNDNLLTRFFSLEYAILFHVMLRGLQKLSIPIPLGGTSNHISMERLHALGEWDPYNVTEDADLGTRLAAYGYRTVMLDSYTLEEAPNTVVPWIRQRSRWIKGYMQTWLVHMRRPGELYLRLGWKGFLGFQFFIGLSCFTFLTAPVVWGLSLAWMWGGWQTTPFPHWLAVLTFVNLGTSLLTHWLLALQCVSLYRKYVPALTLAAILYPFYLVLHTVASYRALWQLIVKPHFWDKTTHGLAHRVETPTLVAAQIHA